VGKFWEGLAGQLGTDWASRLLMPAFMFWGMGALAIGLGHRFDVNQLLGIANHVMGMKTVELGAIVVAALVGLTLSGLAIDHLTLPFLKSLEGYWPKWLNWLLAKRVKVWQGKVADKDKRWQKLADKYRAGTASLLETREYAGLDDELRRFPDNPNDMMPTRLGNILRAAEMRPEHKYGLNVLVTWAALWLVLDKDAKDEVGAARASLDDAVRAVIWSVLTLVWCWEAAWVAIPAVIALIVSWRAVIGSALSYADLVEGLFDAFRGRLYEALGWPRPKNPAEEYAAGQAITIYLRRGARGDVPIFTTAEKTPEAPPDQPC